MELVVLDPDSSLAPFEQVRRQIAGSIESGRLGAGSRLPTVRALAAQVGLAINTVARAYRELEIEGLVTTRGRHGTFVATDSPVARQQAVLDTRQFVHRMRELGVGEADMLVLLRQEVGRLDDE